MSRGDIYLADLNPSRGSEQAGIRPVIVVQRETIDRFTQTVVIVPLTSNLRRLDIPGTFTIPPEEGGLTQESVALCYQIAVVDLPVGNATRTTSTNPTTWQTLVATCSTVG
jgi:mRNA interferase MazF